MCMCLYVCVKEIERETKTKSETEKWNGEGTFIQFYNSTQMTFDTGRKKLNIETLFNHFDIPLSSFYYYKKLYILTLILLIICYLKFHILIE